MRYYLAYGSNLNVEQMRYRCPSARPVGTAMLKGYTLAFRGSGSGSYLTIDEDVHGLVPVAVWAVTKRDEAALDRYEGYPRFYSKRDEIVKVNGRLVKAFVYVMNNRPYGVPSDWYVEVCRQGYRNFGMCERYLDEAVERSRHGQKVS